MLFRSGILKGKVKNKKVRLKWNKSRMANGYLVYRTDAGGKFRQIATLKGSKGVTFTDKKVTTKKTYRYRVRAYRTIKGGRLFGRFSPAIRVAL